MFTLDPILHLLDLGGPVVSLLAALSVLSLAVVLFKLWQFSAVGVGRHAALRQALGEWDRGHRDASANTLTLSDGYLSPLVARAMSAPHSDDLLFRCEAEAEEQFLKLERGFRILDSIAQMSPLLGLFGTVLGMIDAFQALQEAGAAVDPSLLAGGIWVALLTTAVGLAVAMPTALALSWLDARMEAERSFAETAWTTILNPRQSPLTVMPQTHAVAS
ncbi:MotA/TolQ/ExbB proton channel family protein [Epibacterium ulvae]|uniref:MotA/TolQ/ExbB proton channel family protein n=1 Tax=Epibacterium ulvae TaxID=1156985 RepID=UPI001BFCC2F6|nr:MotA/TolQ/ExbB proton channel family protein [Epibacterium ulvae]MBT8155629.1 MotA/TolQ/ExbB proton channel family protein [Epibacterium ulvae]